ncbi:DnaB-like helicase C-terminal domain-containing protein [Salibacterium lacus]|uniref:DnaB-like helicase C-terminal domain-containing protein n=1 Tax=Salibacterium lacus TaxID=1898109 RepID=A0ABW5SWS2_9BACI
MNNNFDLIKSAVSLLDLIGEDVALKKSGRIYKGACPFHDDNTPSFAVYEQDNRFHCFGCGETGDAVDYVMKSRSYPSHLEAMQELAQRYNLQLQDVDTESIKRKNAKKKEEKDEFIGYYRRRAEAARYLESRGFTDGELNSKTFALGYDDQENALVIPFMNAYGEVVGRVHRYLEEDAQPKYKNSAESEVFQKNEMLFGFDKARKEVAQQDDALYLVEGYFDCMAMYQMGVGKTAAYASAHITDGQAHLIKRHIKSDVKIYLIPDNDDSGWKSVRKNLRTLRKQVKNRVSVVTLPDGIKDANDLLLSDYELKDAQIESFEKYLLREDLENCLEIEDEYDVAFDWAKKTPNAMIRGDMAEYLAERWDKPIATVNDFMKGQVKLNHASKLKTGTEAYINLVERTQDKTPKIKTGLKPIDMMTSGMMKKEVCFIQGKSGSGKTTMLLNWIYHAIMHEGRNVLFSTLEMPAESIIGQLIQRHNSETKGKMEQRADEGSFDEGVAELLDTIDKRMRMVDEDSQSVEDIEHFTNEANVNAFDEPADIIFIDYFQYLKMNEGANSYERTSETARAMKGLAKRLNVLVVVLTQVNRMSGGGGSGKTTKESSKDTSSIEDTSDYLLGIYRPASDPNLTEDEKQAIQHEMYCQVLKNRFGAEADVKLWFDGMTKKIEDGKGRF